MTRNTRGARVDGRASASAQASSASRLAQAALGALGEAVPHDEIAPDAQEADLQYEPDPARAAERERLGLLGRLAATLCLIDIYSHAPDRDEVLASIGKLIAFRQQRARASRGRQPPEPSPDPVLWIIAAERPTAVLEDLGATQAPDWPTGVYVGPELLRVRSSSRASFRAIGRPCSCG